MEISSMNQRITILEHRTKIDDIGNHITKWEELYSCWASASVKSSSENFDNGTTKEIIKIEFRIRQNTNLLIMNSTAFRILFRGQIYNITSVKPDYEHKKYMIISCEIKEAGVVHDKY